MRPRWSRVASRNERTRDDVRGESRRESGAGGGVDLSGDYFSGGSTNDSYVRCDVRTDVCANFQYAVYELGALEDVTIRFG